MNGDLNEVLALPFGAGLFQTVNLIGGVAPPPPGDINLVTQNNIDLTTEAGDQYIMNI